VTKFGSIVGRIAKRLPPPTEYEYEPLDGLKVGKTSILPTILEPAVRIFPGIEPLTKDIQEVDVVLEVEGVLHNRQQVSNDTINVIFLLDNGLVLEV